MDNSLAEVAFLASSANRVRALNMLANGAHDHYELKEQLGISRVTVKRILTDFEMRGWIVSEGQTYRTTPFGDIIASEFSALLDTMATMGKLSTALPWLPNDFDVDLRQLADAHITLPSKSDSIAPVRRSVELMDEAETVRGLGAGIAPEALRTNRNRVVDDDQSFEVVFSTDVLDIIAADSTMTGYLVEILDAGGQVYSHENLDYFLGEFDGKTVFMGLTDETGIPRAAIESEDKAMHEWFQSTFEMYRAEAELVSVETLAVGTEVGQDFDSVSPTTES